MDCCLESLPSKATEIITHIRKDRGGRWQKLLAFNKWAEMRSLRKAVDLLLVIYMLNSLSASMTADNPEFKLTDAFITSRVHVYTYSWMQKEVSWSLSDDNIWWSSSSSMGGCLEMQLTGCFVFVLFNDPVWNVCNMLYDECYEGNKPRCIGWSYDLLQICMPQYVLKQLGHCVKGKQNSFLETHILFITERRHGVFRCWNWENIQFWENSF